MKKLLLLLTLLSSIALAAESYICESEAIGGVKFNSQQKKFEGSAFKAGNKNVLTYNKINKIWEWKDFGEATASSIKCTESDFLIECQLFGGEINFHKKNLRFYETYTAGALSSPKDANEKTKVFFEKNTPLIAVGSCAIIN